MTQTWICDTCGLSIDRPEDGYVERLTIPTDTHLRIVQEMRLVHKNNRCQFNEREAPRNKHILLEDRSLKDYIGSDGLMDLLEHLVDPACKNIDVVEMIKRIQIPGYDIARKHFNDAIREGVIIPLQAPGFYSQQDIWDVIAYYES